MKGRVVLLDQIAGRNAAALMVDGRLEDFALDPEGDEPLPGAIYRAVAERPMKGQGGLFVRLPTGNGFLRQTGGIAPGQRIIVQVSGAAEPGKALPVTTRLLFKSRFVIVTPGAPGLNISRKIKDDDLRRALEALAAEGMAGAGEGLGLILRSACAVAEPDAVAEDIVAMRGLAEAVTADLSGGPELLFDGPGAHDLAYRDWLDPEPDEVVTDEGCFGAHGVLEALEALLTPRVDLRAGGRSGSSRRGRWWRWM